MKLLILLLSVLLLPVLSGETFQIGTSKKSNLFAPSETLVFTVKNAPAASIKYQITNYLGKVLASGEAKMANGAGAISLKPQASWGKRYLVLKVGDYQLPFAIIPERKSAKGGDDRFGGWIERNEMEACVRLGFTTSYPHWNILKTRGKNLRFPKKYDMTLATNYTVAPLSYNYRKHWKDLTTVRNLMKTPEVASFPKRVEEYIAYAWKQGLKRTSDSFSGEYCFFDTIKSDNLRDQHRIFYAAAKKAAPDFKVGLGLFMAYGASSLKCVLVGTTPQNFKFDYVGYDVCGIGDGIENFLKSEIKIMEKWGRRVPQWVCEIWGSSWEDREAAASVSRIYGACLGLNCVEIDWHAITSKYETKAEWEAARKQKKIPTVFLPKFSQAFFRGKRYLPTQSVIAFYHVYDKLSFARPVGEIKEDVNLASYQFRKKDGSYVTMFWTRRYPASITLNSKEKTLVFTDYMGESAQKKQVKGGAVTFSLRSYPVFVESKAKLQIKGQKILTRNWYKNKD